MIDHRPVLQRRGTRGIHGFSLIEMLIALVVVSVVVVEAMPLVRNALFANNLRSARQTVSTAAATARSAAVARGCRTTLHLRASGAVWITGCKQTGPGIDTLVRVDSIAKRFSISMTSTTDSVVFTPRGLRGDVQATVIRFSKSGFSATDSVIINSLGKVAY